MPQEAVHRSQAPLSHRQMSRVAGENVDGRVISASGFNAVRGINTNYTVATSIGSLTITARPFTITPDAKTKVYSNTDLLLTYSVTPGNLITPKAITITADAKTKVYGAVDPELTYTSTSGALAGDDLLSGSLTRRAGGNVGLYKISTVGFQGLELNSNYKITG
jgi:MBG domain (YGX type)